MKRIFLLLLCIAMVILSSCAPPEAGLRDSFTVPVSVSGTLDITAGLSKTPDSFTLRLLSPDSLAGLCYTYRGGELTTSYNGLRCITDEGALPDTALPRMLYTVQRDVKNAFLRHDEGGDVFQLYGMTVTIREGLPVRIDITDPSYSIVTDN